MPFCTNCGSETRTGVRFCESCGATMDAAQSPSAPVGHVAPAAKTSRKWVLPLAIGLGALAVAAAVVLVLVFTVFSGGGDPGMAQFQLREGQKMEYYLPSIEDYTESKAIDVKFDLKGPWDFSKGPDDLVATDTVKKADEVEGSEDFEGATAVMAREYQDVTEDLFVSQDEEGFNGVGMIYDYSKVEGGTVFNLAYTEPDVYMKYPLKIGDSWDSEYDTEDKGEKMSTETRARKVIAKNSIKVPAGTFSDCYMVRGDATYDQGNGRVSFTAYSFYVPDVGLVATVTSLDDETDDTFDKARDLVRLKKVVSQGTTPITGSAEEQSLVGAGGLPASPEMAIEPASQAVLPVKGFGYIVFTGGHRKR